MRIAITLLAALPAIILTCTSAARGEPADDLALLQQHNQQAHLLALWRLGQPDAAASLSADQARALYRALDDDEDWRVRWLAAEALAEARRTAIASGTAAADDINQRAHYLNYSLDNWLNDEAQPVREAAARAVATQQGSEHTRVSREMIAALGDESALVCEPIASHVGRIIVANPEVISSLLWQYMRADSDPYEKAEGYLDGYVISGRSDVEPGRALLAEHVRELQCCQSLICRAFKQAGEAAMPELLKQWDEQPRLHEPILRIWSSMGTSAAAAGPRLEPVLADLDSPLWWDAAWAAQRIAAPNREQLAQLMLPRVCCEKPSWSVIDTLERLGPLPDSVAQSVIDYIPEIEGRDQQDLIRMLAAIGPHSERVFRFLTELAQDDGVPEEARATALHSLALIARVGNLETARFVIQITAEDEKQRSSIIHTLLYDDQLLGQPEIVALLVNETGALEVALKQPKLLELPALKAQAGQEVLAEITDPKTPPARIIRVASLLPSLDLALPPGAEETLWAQYEHADPSSGSGNDYVRALARLYPARARALYLEICDSDQYRDRAFSGNLLDGLGAECKPLLPVLVDQLIGAEAAEKLQEVFAGEAVLEFDKGVSANYDQDFDLFRRYRLVKAIAACGSDASPFAPQLLWALKRAYYERESEPIPEKVLKLPKAQREQLIRHSHRHTDLLIEALIEAVSSVGPEALPAVLQAANGSMNDGAVWYGSSADYLNPEHDRRLRTTALQLAGELGTGRADVAQLFIRRRTEEWYWSTSVTRGDELDVQRLLVCVAGLGQVGVANDEVILALLNSAQDENPEVQAVAVASLRKLAGWEYPAVE